MSSLNNRRTYIQGLQALKKESGKKEQLWRPALALSKYICIYFLDIDASKEIKSYSSWQILFAVKMTPDFKKNYNNNFVYVFFFNLTVAKN